MSPVNTDGDGMCNGSSGNCPNYNAFVKKAVTETDEEKKLRLKKMRKAENARKKAARVQANKQRNAARSTARFAFWKWFRTQSPETQQDIMKTSGYVAPNRKAGSAVPAAQKRNNIPQ